jgi:signal transduction histidine kinase
MNKDTKFFVGAILSSFVVYLIPLYFGKAWLGLFLLLLLGASFLGVFVKYFNFNVESKVKRFVFSVFALVLVSFHALSFAHDYGRKDYQKKNLIEIRQIIEEGITKSAVQKKLIYVLSQYHLQDEYSLIEMVELILSENLLVDGSFDEHPDQEEPEDAMSYFYQKKEELNTFKVIGVSKVVPGANASFNNYDGQTGQLQIEIVLTEEGVTYEVVN